MSQKLKLFYPIKPMLVTQKWGENEEFYRENYSLVSHNGWDMVGWTGQTIYAAHEGEVTFTGEDGRGGLGIVIRTLKPYEYEGGEAYYKTIYWHCLPNSFMVKPGDIVSVGDPIAKCDTTGFTGGPHLHFGIKPVRKGEKDWEWYNIEQNKGWAGAIDPEPFFNGIYASDAQGLLQTLKEMVGKLTKLMSIYEQSKKGDNTVRPSSS